MQAYVKKRILKNGSLYTLLFLVPFVLSLFYIGDILTKSFETVIKFKTLTYSEQAFWATDWSQLTNFHYYTAFLGLFLPLLSMVGYGNFREDLLTYYPLSRSRLGGSYQWRVLKTIVLSAILISFTLALSHFLFYFLATSISADPGDILTEAGDYLFHFLLPTDYFHGRPLIFFAATIFFIEWPILLAYEIYYGVLVLYTYPSRYTFYLLPLFLTVITTFSFIILPDTLAAYLSLDDVFQNVYVPIGASWKFMIFPACLALGLWLWWHYHDKGCHNAAA